MRGEMRHPPGVFRMRLALLLPLASAWLLGAGPAFAQVSDPPVVIDAFQQARAARDVDRALALFTSDGSVTLDYRGPGYGGREEIRQILTVLVLRGAPVQTSSRHVVGNTITWTERDQNLDLAVEAVVKEGKIQSLVYRDEHAAAAEPTTLPVGLLAFAAAAALVLVFAGVLSLVGLPFLRRPARSSRLQGRLLAKLHDWRLGRQAM
jgi:hypothetical protein